jgi:hypothetical protein
MHQINTFWRLSPASPFPWEIGQDLGESTSAEKLAEPLSEPKKDENWKQVEIKQEVQK